MDLSRIVNMIINMVLRKVVGRGVDAGINYATRRGAAEDPMTPEQLQSAQDAKLMAKRARQAANLTKRL